MHIKIAGSNKRLPKAFKNTAFDVLTLGVLNCRFDKYFLLLILTFSAFKLTKTYNHTIMKKVNVIILFMLTMFASTHIFAQLSPEEKIQRIKASYAIVSGREPVTGEVEHWKKQADLTVQQ